jgi:hypothetical protein
MDGSSCWVCRAQLLNYDDKTSGMIVFNCPRCGQFYIGAFPIEIFKRHMGNEFDKSPNLRYITSHAIRRMQPYFHKDYWYPVNSDWLRSVWSSEKLPNPQKQADTFVQYLSAADVPSGEWVPIQPVQLTGILGTADDPNELKKTGLEYVIQHLLKKGLIERDAASSAPDIWACRLTFGGWERFEELHRASGDSTTAFMAMAYGKDATERAFTEFVHAVQQTGFELHKLDQKPKAGLIDLRMRVEIRLAKFLIADLTDENRGEYWEAGFAEGLGKKVYYTCEASKFHTAKTHFDTEHMLTIKWSSDNMAAALDVLKSAIRNDFPTEAKQSDEPIAKP